MRSPSRVSLWGHFRQLFPHNSLSGGTVLFSAGHSEALVSQHCMPGTSSGHHGSQNLPAQASSLLKHSRDYFLVRFVFLQMGKQAQKRTPGRGVTDWRHRCRCPDPGPLPFAAQPRGLPPSQHSLECTVPRRQSWPGQPPELA